MHIAQIQRLLTVGGCPEHLVQKRSEILDREMSRLNLPVYYPMPNQFTGMAEYRIGDTGFSIDNAKDASISARNSSGTGFDRGSLLYLARVLEIAGRKIPEFLESSESLANGLSCSRTHLDTLNEIWWLNRLKNTDVLGYEVKLHQNDNSSDVDWQLQIDSTDQIVNLEVKRRPGDVRRLDSENSLDIRGVFENGLRTESGKLKFPQSIDNQMNVLAVTIYCPIDRSVQDAANEFIDLNALNVDGVAIWSWSGEKCQFVYHTGTTPSKADQLRKHIAELDAEDAMEKHVVACPYSVPGLNPTLILEL